MIICQHNHQKVLEKSGRSIGHVTASCNVMNGSKAKFDAGQPYRRLQRTSGLVMQFSHVDRNRVNNLSSDTPAIPRLRRV